MGRLVEWNAGIEEVIGDELADHDSGGDGHAVHEFIERCYACCGFVFHSVIGY